MDIIRRNKGVISIYLCIILLAVTSLSGLLIDGARLRSGENLIREGVRNSAKSYLSNYNSLLANDYGIFAFNGSEALHGPAAASVGGYLNKNLMTRYAFDLSGGQNGIKTRAAQASIPRGTLNLYDFKIENITVVPGKNLLENSILKSQILEHMKYRAPKELISGFLDRLKIFEHLGVMSEAYNKKTAIDKLLGRMDKAQQRLKRNIDGDGAEGKLDVYVNGFNEPSSWGGTLNSYISKCSQLSAAKLALREFREENSGEGSSGPGYIIQIIAMQANITTITQSANDLWSSLRNKNTRDFTKPNTDSLKEMERILEHSADVSLLASELSEFLVTSFDGIDSGISKEFLTSVNNDIKSVDLFIADGEKAKSIVDDINQNIDLLEKIGHRVDRFQSWMHRAEFDADQALAEADVPGLLALIGQYKNIEYSYNKTTKGEKKADPRSKAEAAALSILEIFGSEDTDYRNEGVIKEQLPSFSKDGHLNPTPEAEFDKDTIDLFDPDNSPIEGSLRISKVIGSMISGNISALMDNIYINEYIMGTFKNAVPKSKKDSNPAEEDDRYFNGKVKSERDTFYTCEAEYILHGSPSQNINRQLTKGQLLMMRFGLNTLHVYSDAQKKVLANSIAAAVAGWWTGGAGIPVISNLVMCGWAMSEAAIDVSDILNGEGVPIYKLKGDWKLDIGLPADADIGDEGEPGKLSELYYLSYYDYLRIFLLVTDQDTKLNRIADLIQLNAGIRLPGFLIRNYNAGITVEADVSINMLFLGRLLLPDGLTEEERLKNQDGRRRIRVVVHEKY